MPSLTGLKPKNTFKDLLQVSNSNSGIDATLRNVEDGEGSSAPIQLSTAAVNITALQLSGTAVTVSAAEINLLDALADGSVVVGNGTTGTTFALLDSSTGPIATAALPTVPLTKGGTGATTAGAALTNLGVTAFAQTVLDDADAGTARATLGVPEIASAVETTTGTDATKAVSPDGLAGSDFGKTIVSVLVLDSATDCETGDGAGDVFFRVPEELNGQNLVRVAAAASTAGTTGTMDIQIRNATQAADMLTTKITIDSAETDSSTAATAAVIDSANDDVATGDQIFFDIDAVQTTKAQGLIVEMAFQKP